MCCRQTPGSTGRPLKTLRAATGGALCRQVAFASQMHALNLHYLDKSKHAWRWRLQHVDMLLEDIEMKDSEMGWKGAGGFSAAQYYESISFMLLSQY